MAGMLDKLRPRRTVLIRTTKKADLPETALYVEWLGGQMSTPVAAENAGTLVAAGTVSVTTATASDLTVTLVSEDPAQLTFVVNPITIAAGTTAKAFDIVLTNDPVGVPDSNRLITITATAATFNQGSADFQILDDDIGAPFVSWNTSAESVAETDSPIVMLTAVLSHASAVPIVVPYTVGGAATSGTDYQAIATPHQITINSGSQGSVAILLIDDAEIESAEDLTLTMGTPTNAVVGQGSYVLTIADDDDGGGGTNPGGSGNAVSKGCACDVGADSRSAGVSLAGWIGLGVAVRLRSSRRRRSSMLTEW